MSSVRRSGSRSGVGFLTAYAFPGRSGSRTPGSTRSKSGEVARIAAMVCPGVAPFSETPFVLSHRGDDLLGR
jgi:hypothetical protein